MNGGSLKKTQKKPMGVYCKSTALNSKVVWICVMTKHGFDSAHHNRMMCELKRCCMLL